MIKGDKIKLVKPMGAFTYVGEVCEVTDIMKGGVIYFRFGGVHLGCMSYDEYEKYFEPVKEKAKREWTRWIRRPYNVSFVYNANGMSMNDENSGSVWYRFNGKRVQVKTFMSDKSLKASASCCKNDTFDLDTGLALAFKRLFPKVLAYLTECEAKKM